MHFILHIRIYSQGTTGCLNSPVWNIIGQHTSRMHPKIFIFQGSSASQMELIAQDAVDRALLPGLIDFQPQQISKQGPKAA